MINYSNGTTYSKIIKLNKANTSKPKSFNHGNRGMDLENDINFSNDFYRKNGECLITKRPTPINVVHVDYAKGAIIDNAYFEKQSTTDYNGVYKGKYIDFEAKSTRKTTSFPLGNISPHQIDHLTQVIKHGGIAFFIIEFSKLEKVYLLDAQFVIDFYFKNKRRSIPYKTFLDNGLEIKKAFNPRLKYLDAIKKLYFNQ